MQESGFGASRRTAPVIGLQRRSALSRSGVWPLVTGAEMQALDRRTIDGLGVSGEILMESAGRSLVAAACALRAESARPDAPIRALCGAGNNGGDGFVLVRHLRAEGIPSEVVLVGDPERLPADAAANWARLVAIDAPRRVVAPEDRSFDWADLLASSSVAVDALFGTGLSRDLEGGFAHIVEACARARDTGLRVLSVDLPSGVCADTGAVLGAAIEADATVTISLPKLGLALEPGASRAGRVHVARVGIADPQADRLPRAELWNDRGAAARLPTRPRDGHKGRFGHVLVVAGSVGKAGAGALSARAAARAGAGLVTLAHPLGVEAELASLPVEVMSSPLAATADGGLSPAGEKAIDELVAARDVVALGPGIGRAPETVALVERLVRTVDRPLVIDADGLNALVGRLGLVAERAQPTVLTPHPGEAARLLERTNAQINRDRPESARTLARESDAVVVLKGARTVVADPEGRIAVVPTGGPALSSGGTGDVLTGVVAALLAARLEAFEAASLAAYWHGAAADDRPQAKLGFGLLASEVADALPRSATRIVERAMAEEESSDPLVLRFPGP